MKVVAERLGGTPMVAVRSVSNSEDDIDQFDNQNEYLRNSNRTECGDVCNEDDPFENRLKRRFETTDLTAIHHSEQTDNEHSRDDQ